MFGNYGLSSTDCKSALAERFHMIRIVLRCDYQDTRLSIRWRKFATHALKASNCAKSSTINLITDCKSVIAEENNVDISYVSTCFFM